MKKYHKITKRGHKCVKSAMYTVPFILVGSETGLHSCSGGGGRGEGGEGGRSGDGSKSAIGIVSVCSVVSFSIENKLRLELNLIDSWLF